MYELQRSSRANVLTLAHGSKNLDNVRDLYMYVFGYVAKSD